MNDVGIVAISILAIGMGFNFVLVISVIALGTVAKFIISIVAVRVVVFVGVKASDGTSRSGRVRRRRHRLGSESFQGRLASSTNAEIPRRSVGEDMYIYVVTSATVRTIDSRKFPWIKFKADAIILKRVYGGNARDEDLF